MEIEDNQNVPKAAAEESSPNESAAIHPTWKITLRIWWAWLWRTSVWYFLATFFLGFIGGFTGRYDQWANSPLWYLLQSLVGLVISVYVLRGVFRLEFGSFRIGRISPRNEVGHTSNHGEKDPFPSWVSVLKFWWAWLWRTAIIVFPIIQFFIWRLRLSGVFEGMTVEERFISGYWVGVFLGGTLNLIVAPLILTFLLKKKLQNFGFRLVGALSSR